ncbi:aminoacyl-tRNA hydrolase [Patescibacteria group bacterium]|nr:aminoacyl-tRNA hydrolase [Patescibacteria group bacterium]
MKLMVGLGNPGKKYQKTRHNVGWMVLDKLADGKKWNESKKAKALYLKKEVDGQQVELIKPTTYMNESGYAANYAFGNHNLNIDDVFVVYDDIDLPIGAIRVGKFTSSGGHKGVQSIIDNLKSKDFIRFRVGIKNDKTDKQPAEKFVLQKFSLFEKKQINESIQRTVEAIKLALKAPLDEVMNKFN